MPGIYLDNAATTFPKPEPVYAAMDAFLRTEAGNAGRSGHLLARGADATLARARLRLARLLNAEAPERIVWTFNATDGLNQALKGWLRPGDRVVTTCLEHNAVARPLRSLEQHGVQVERVPGEAGRFALGPFLEAITSETRLVAMVHASNVTGEVLPVAEVGVRCQALGVPLLVDAAQSAGALPIDVRGMGIDLLAMPGHKALLGPPGTGALYVREGLDLEPLREGGTGSASESDEQPGNYPDRLESGTLNSVGIAGLGAALEWLGETGVEKIHRHELALTAALWEGLRGIQGITLYGPPPEGERAAIVSFALEGWEPTDVAAVLDSEFGVQCRAGLHCAPWAHATLGTFPAGTVRLSPGFFNTETEIEAVVTAVRELAAESPY